MMLWDLFIMTAPNGGSRSTGYNYLPQGWDDNKEEDVGSHSPLQNLPPDPTLTFSSPSPFLCAVSSRTRAFGEYSMK